MEIKQGDKVRILDNVPEIYTQTIFSVHIPMEMEVVKVQDGSARIRPILSGLSGLSFEYIIPCKYLVKVDAEAKEAKAKIGSDKWVDKTVWNYKNHKKGVIRRMTDGVAEVFTEDGRLQTWQIEDLVDEYDDPIEKWKCPEPTASTIKVGDRVRNIESGLIGVVDKIVYGNIAWVNGVDGKRYHWKSDELELVEPTEQTEAEKKPNVGSIKIPVEVDLTDSYWDAYAADLAKEIVLKTVNSASDKRPSVIAEYAVSVAKAVVEGLKRK